MILTIYFNYFNKNFFFRILGVVAKSISLQEIHLSNIGVRSEFGAKLGQAMAMNPLCRLVKLIKFIYSEEATKFEEIFHLMVLNNVKTKWKTSSKENFNFSMTHYTVYLWIWNFNGNKRSHF